ncbi:hypothetical protein AA0313_2925 [Acetobacter indonesiensis NRIC 0313]|uniref:Uncharacterized protein n=1 Tax=Acetobacter indonesiensis TaxID=104101 RepID=A0A6N3T9G9_9PROT|nr:hypothetical protein Abin_074_004 [Acetobacter indonesiensis]GBQ62266.1 hypothetical protein AA0313_2925 [Acetobacter indonesiensis NRIC 0313]GEN04940.1 hypothetical protein AIN02nite_29650 [Acetobacter indonesiensis]
MAECEPELSSDGSENNEPVSGSANNQVDAWSSLEVAGNDTQNPAGVTTQVYIKRESGRSLRKLYGQSWIWQI